MRRWIQTMSACETTIAVILEHCTRLHEQRQQQARRAPAHTLQRHMWPHGTSTTLIVLSEQTLHNCRSLENLPTRARTHTHTHKHNHPRTSHNTCLLLLRAALGQLQRFKKGHTTVEETPQPKCARVVSYLLCALDARAAAPASRFPQGQQARPHLEHKRHTSNVTRHTSHVARQTSHVTSHVKRHTSHSRVSSLTQLAEPPAQQVVPLCRYSK